MKIRIFILISLLAIPFLSFAESCGYLEKPEMSFLPDDVEGRFNYHFAIELCKNNEKKKIHKDILDYITWIKDTKWKTVTQLIREAGNRFCRWQFWNLTQEELQELNKKAKESEWKDAKQSKDLFCNRNSFYHRFVRYCDEAVISTVKKLSGNEKDQEKIESFNSKQLRFSFGENNSKLSGCEMLAEQYIMAYKEVAMEEIARYHAKIIENSNITYFSKIT